MRPEWDDLLLFPCATTFSTWEWLAPWWRAFGAGDQLRFLELRDATSKSLVALAPLALTMSRRAGFDLRILRLMGDGSGDSDNLDLPARAGREAEAARGLLAWMEVHAGDWDICRLNTLPEQSPVGTQLLAQVQARGWPSLTRTQPQSLIELGNDWESYLTTLSSKERGKIRYLTQRLEKKYRVRILRCAESRELDSRLDALFELHAKHWHPRGMPGSFQSEARRRFYREIGSLLLERGRLEFWLLELNGNMAAAQFGFRHGNSAFALQEGFDPDHSSDSVGYVLRSQVIRQLICQGVRRYDFLAGVDPSKARWGARVQSYINIEFARPHSRGSAYLALTHAAIHAKVWLRSRLSPRTWQTLKALAGVRQPDTSQTPTSSHGKRAGSGNGTAGHST